MTAEYPDAGPALREQTDNWQALATDAFFKSYLRAMKEHPLFPSNPATVETLITLFLVEKTVAAASHALAEQLPTVDISLRQLVQMMRRKR